MITVFYPSRTKPLYLSTLLAIIFHISLLYAIMFQNLPSAQNFALEKGVEIDLAPIIEQSAKQEEVKKIEEIVREEIKSDDVKQVEQKIIPTDDPALKKVEPIKKQKKTEKQKVVSKPIVQGQEAIHKETQIPATAPEPLTNINNAKPIYPELARRRSQEGLVELKAYVDSSGNLTNLVISKSSGFSLLDESALKAVKKWKFKPAYKAGIAVSGVVTIPIQFRLKSK